MRVCESCRTATCHLQQSRLELPTTPVCKITRLVSTPPAKSSRHTRPLLSKPLKISQDFSPQDANRPLPVVANQAYLQNLSRLVSTPLANSSLHTRPLLSKPLKISQDFSPPRCPPPTACSCQQCSFPHRWQIAVCIPTPRSDLSDLSDIKPPSPPLPLLPHCSFQ